MSHKVLSLSTPCPCCAGSLLPASLTCPKCELTLGGKIQINEFASLSVDDLQLLRMFLKFEGRVRDMEAPLGLSYPTIRARISELKERVFAGELSNEKTWANENELNKESKNDSKGEALEILRQLNEGVISFDKALTEIKKSKPKKK